MALQYIEHRRRSRAPQVSVILIDWGVRESFHSLEYLNRQTLPRDKYELIWVEFYDKTRQQREQSLQAGISGSGSFVDKLVILGHPRGIHYHKHFMYNVGIVLAEGAICVVCDSDAIFAPTFLHSIQLAFKSRSRLVLHVDEVRSENRSFYPFNYPEISTILAAPHLINWVGSTTKGLANSADRLHEANYGACMCASRRDLLAIGGADEHLDYLGYICGPYEMTFRLVNDGCREHWLGHEWIYHVWHPGQAGSQDYGGPHDGRNVSLRALDLRSNGRTQPWVRNEAVALSRDNTSVARDVLLARLAEHRHEEWDRAAAALTRLDPVELVEEGFHGYNLLRHGAAFIGLHQEEGSYARERLLAAQYHRCFCAETVTAVKAAIEEGERSRFFLANLDPRTLAPLVGAPPRRDSNPPAIEASAAFIKHDDRPARSRETIRSRLLARLGWAHYYKRMYDDAFRVFDEAVRLDSGNLRAVAGRGWTYLQRGRTASAVRDFGMLIERLPLDECRARAEALRGRAWAHCYDEQFQHAVEDFDGALEGPATEPHDRVDILRGRSRALYMTGEIARALDDFRASPALRGGAPAPCVDRAVLALHARTAVWKSRIKRAWLLSVGRLLNDGHWSIHPPRRSDAS